MHVFNIFPILYDCKIGKKWKEWKRYWFQSKFGSENKMPFVKMVSINLLHTYLIMKSFKNDQGKLVWLLLLYSIFKNTHFM